MVGHRCCCNVKSFAAIVSVSILFFCIDNHFRAYPSLSTLIRQNILHVVRPINFCLAWTLPSIVKKVSVSLPWRHSYPSKDLRTKSRDENGSAELHSRKMASKENNKKCKNGRKPRTYDKRKSNRLEFDLIDSRQQTFNIEQTCRIPISNKIMTDKCQNTKYDFYNTNMVGKVSVGDLSFKYFRIFSGASKTLTDEIKSVYFIAVFVLCLTLLYLNTIGYWNITIETNAGPVDCKTSSTVTFSTWVHRSSNGLTMLFTKVIYKNVYLTSILTFRVPTEIPEFKNYGKLRKIHGKENCEWLYLPTQQFHDHLKNVIAYPIFEFYRLASFRPLAYTEMPGSTFFVNLSTAGFYYSGTGTYVECSGCGNTLDLVLVSSDPSELKYHKEGCRFLTSPGELRVPIENVDKTLTSHEVRNEVLALPSNGGQHVAGDTDEGIDMTPPDMTVPPLVIVPQNHNEREIETNAETFPHVTGLNKSPLTGQFAITDSKDFEPGQSSRSASSTASVYKPTSSLPLPGRRGPHINNLELYRSDQETPYCDIETLKSENPAFYDNRLNGDSVKTLRCEKNQGHLSSFPLSSLQLDHLPSKLRHKLLADFLAECSLFVVKIAVSKISPKRSLGDQIKLLQVKQFRIGNGSVLNHPYQIGTRESNPEHADPTGTVSRIRQSGILAPNMERIFIETSRNLIYDNEEAKNSTVHFTFDGSEILNGVSITGKSVMHSTILGDFRSVLVCEVPEKFVKMLNKRREDLFRLAERLPASIKETMTRHVVIISHPHGDDPRISHGESTLIKYNIDVHDRGGRLIGVLEKVKNHHPGQVDLAKTRKTLLYTAVTCDGSLGAPVITFQRMAPSDPSGGQSEFKLDIWMHYGFDTVHELNVSGMKACTTHDFPPQGIPQSFTTSVSTVPSAEIAGGTTDQQTPRLPEVSTHLITVLTAPAYPIYSNAQKRLDSFVNWPPSHFHIPANLASAGFFYAGYADCVRCFQCGLGLKSWKPGDDVTVEHERHRPSCPFLQAQINNGLTSRHPVNGLTTRLPINNTNSVTYGEVQNQDTASARNSSNERAGTYQQTGTELPDSQVLQQAVTEQLKHHSAADSDENKLVESEALEPTNHPQSLPVTLLRRENKTLQLQMTCKICRNSPIKELFLPCGDLYACSHCSQQLTHCPACKKLILATVTTYFS